MATDKLSDHLTVGQRGDGDGIYLGVGGSPGRTFAPLMELDASEAVALRDYLNRLYPRITSTIPKAGIDRELPTHWGEPEHFEEAQTVALVNIARSLERIAAKPGPNPFTK